MHRPSKKSKGESFDTLGYLLEFYLLVLVVLSVRPGRLRIVHLFPVCPAKSVSRKKTHFQHNCDKNIWNLTK